MTSQEVFNKVWDWFIVKKNPPSLDSNKTCQYRGPNGARCAIGIFIDDNDYDEAFEGMSVGDILGNRSNSKLTTFISEHLSLLEELQSEHDTVAVDYLTKDFHVVLRVRLLTVAKYFNLKLPTTTNLGFTA